MAKKTRLSDEAAGAEKSVMSEEDAYVACELRERMSITGAAHIMDIKPREVSAATARVLVYITSKEFALLQNFVDRDKSATNLSEFTMKAWKEYVENHGLAAKPPKRRNYNYRKEFIEQFEDVFRKG